MFYYFSKIAFVFVLYICVAKGNENSMINSVTLPKFGSSKINQNKAMENPSFKGDNAETDKNVNYKDWAKKNAAKIALGATALAGVVAAGILMRGRGSSKVNNLTEELQEDATQVLNNTLEKFRQEGNIFRKGTAITKDGKRYTGELVNTKKDGSNVILTFEDGVLRSSKIVKDGETIVDKSYRFVSDDEYFKVAGKKFYTGKVSTMEINGKKPLCCHLGYAMQKDNVHGYLYNACVLVPHDKNVPMCPIPETITIGGKKLTLEFMQTSQSETNAGANNSGFALRYFSEDINNHANNFIMDSDFNFVKGKKRPIYEKLFYMRIEKFKEEFGTLFFDGGLFQSKKKNDLFKYNYHTKEISDLNGISKEDAQEMVDFWERHYAASKKILDLYSKQKSAYSMPKA